MPLSGQVARWQRDHSIDATATQPLGHLTTPWFWDALLYGGRFAQLVSPPRPSHRGQCSRLAGWWGRHDGWPRGRL